jgi:hypothetical protein
LKRTKNNLLNFADREPYDPVTELIDVPTALLEVVTLAEKAERGDTSAAKQIRVIMTSVVDVVLADPESLLKLENMVQNGYRIAFLPTEKPVQLDKV